MRTWAEAVEHINGGFWLSSKLFLLFIDMHKTNSTNINTVKKTTVHKSEPP